MKKSHLFVPVLFLFSAFFPVMALADTVITAPVDSRPVSNSYLETLVSLNNDRLLTVSEDSLDLFTNETQRFADSASVRAQIREYVKNNPSEDTTVIINTPSYFTGGLIGSRCADEYKDTGSAIKDLLSLVTDYPKPKYYVNIAMPRNLPETRGQEIWPDDKKIKGLASFLLEHDSARDDCEKIEKSYAEVTPAQFLMEYGYVYNKKTENGSHSLTVWEREFLDFANKNYAESRVYGPYIESYITPFRETAKICDSLVRWQRSGKIDEIIIGNDDLQLPESISYFFSKGDSWINTENGTPVKYSFSRTYMNIGKDSVLERLKRAISPEEAQRAMTGQGESVNFIFGMDEIPQLIYARSLARKYGFSADIDIINYKTGFVAGDYDVLTSERLAQNAVNFISAGLEPQGEKLSLFIYDYSAASESDRADFLSLLSAARSSNSIGLIELYTYSTISSGNNYILKSLIEPDQNSSDISIADLSVFSAWNTNANAIGIGVANAGVYALSGLKTENIPEFAQKQANILCQHIFDDGLYYGGIREKLSSQGYIPSPDETDNSRYLCELLEPQKITDAFEGKRFTVNGKTAYITQLSLVKAAFPWQRLFDCEIQTQCSAREIKILK
ncbi:DUF4127 family protein [Lachnospiraceae bacterium NSJ-143]|nr:DUF4127 family protein [Lachnospiraceae bacterium NSJ-143]